MNQTKTKWVAVVGSRDFSALKKVREYVDSLPKSTIIISGGARGVDRAAENAAKDRKLGTLIFYPDWTVDGKSAGIKRNEKIVSYADELVAFWDGQSRGTWNSIERARKKGIPVTIIGEE